MLLLTDGNEKCVASRFRRTFSASFISHLLLWWLVIYFVLYSAHVACVTRSKSYSFSVLFQIVRR